MLNISDIKVQEGPIISKYDAFKAGINPKYGKILALWVLGTLLTFIILLFLPWTQNISGKGKLTTLLPSQRPQVIPASIDGRIEQWYVLEGDTIMKGDTIAHMSEIKYELADPALLQRTQEQLDAKRTTMTTYRDKADALAGQITALRSNLDLKMEQLRNKIWQARYKLQADSIDLIAADTARAVAFRQYERTDSLLNLGIKSRTQREDKLNKYQETQAKYQSQQNKLNVSRQELINARIELNNTPNEYREKIAKAESDRQSALSSLFGAQGDIAKMQNLLSSYAQRVGFRYILAPQDGFINKAFTPGIGETVKTGDPIVSIVPLNFQVAAEIFIRPVDLPLIRKGENVRLQFDGWPAIVFSGWPNASFGTFGGKVFAVESNISGNGLYRLLIEPDPDDEPWPTPLRPGSGVEGFSLLEDVPLWYELWRQLNGFPPNFYEGDVNKADLGGDKKK
jgi:multidrug efflux pump subunit AcrA (membrane-fusion protein)